MFTFLYRKHRKGFLKYKNTLNDYNDERISEKIEIFTTQQK